MYHHNFYIRQLNQLLAQWTTEKKNHSIHNAVIIIATLYIDLKTIYINVSNICSSN